jgi:hypothetical protein
LRRTYTSLCSLALLATSIAALPGSSLSATPIDPAAAATALGAALTEGSNSSASYEEARLEGENVMISGLTLVHGSATDTLRFAETVIEDPSVDGEGVFHSPTITFSDGVISGDSSGVVGKAVLKDVTVLEPKKPPQGGLGSALLFHTAEASDVRLAYEGERSEVTVARIQMEAGNVVDDIPQDSKGVVEGIRIPSELLSTSLLRPKKLGYDEMVLDITWDSTRDVQSGTMSIRDLTVKIHDGGDLSMRGVIGSLPDPRILNDADVTAEASKMEVHEITLQYEDKSLAGRILDQFAEKQGLTRVDYAGQVSAALPFLLASLNDPEFQGQVANAIGTFLQDPQSLTIRIAPDTPISGEEILKLAKTAPQSLPDRLNATVTANAPQ